MLQTSVSSSFSSAEHIPELQPSVYSSYSSAKHIPMLQPSVSSSLPTTEHLIRNGAIFMKNDLKRDMIFPDVDYEHRKRLCHPKKEQKWQIAEMKTRNGGGHCTDQSSSGLLSASHVTTFARF